MREGRSFSLYFKRAFDSVSHFKLFTKLQAYGISGVLSCWIRNFLHCRTQQTRVGNTLSNITNLISGVVQGSVLGPLLFVIFVNDIAQLFTDNTCTCKLYADDLKLYTVLHTNTDCCVRQSKLNEVCEWSKMAIMYIAY